MIQKKQGFASPPSGRSIDPVCVFCGHPEIPQTRTCPRAVPQTLRAAVSTDGPGIGSTDIPSATASRTTRTPGSEMQGVPASEIRATLFPSAKIIDQLLSPMPLAVFVEADQGSVDIIMRKELPAPSGVFGSDEVNLLQYPQSAQGNILQISDGGAHNIEGACFFFLVECLCFLFLYLFCFSRQKETLSDKKTISDWLSEL